jgi:tryptophan-rich sensory protein
MKKTKNQRKTVTDWKLLAFSVGISLFAGFAGSLYTNQSISWWYPMLVKPSFTPPDWIFGPVWTLLFVLMGYALYLILRKGLKAKGVSDAVAVFGVQLVLNVVWSYLFFGLRNPLLAFVEVVVLWFTILITYSKFHDIDRTAGHLLIPYLVWVGFAGVLNLAIVLMN